MLLFMRRTLYPFLLIAAFVLAHMLPVQAQWNAVTGSAFEIGSGGTGTIWSIRQDRPSPTSTHTRNIVQRYNGSSWETIATSFGGTALDVAPDNHAYLVDDTGAVYKYNGTAWRMFGNKKARDIGVGHDGSVWIISNEVSNVRTDYLIYRWDGRTWQLIRGAGVRIDVGPDGNAWVINAAGQAWQYDGRNFNLRAGPAARDITVGQDGAVWIAAEGTDRAGGPVYRWDGSRWKAADGLLSALSASRGRLWGVNRLGNIWMRRY